MSSTGYFREKFEQVQKENTEVREAIIPQKSFESVWRFTGITNVLKELVV